MRKFLLYSLFGLFVMSSVGCKYEEGPWISLRSTERRLVNSWKFTFMQLNGSNGLKGSGPGTINYNLSTVGFNDEGRFSVTWKYVDDPNDPDANSQELVTGNWSFEDDDETLIMDYDTISCGSTSGPGAPCNKTSLIEDLGSDIGELTYSLPSEMLCGTMCASINLNSLATQDGFINLSGTSTSRENALIDLRIKDGSGDYEFTESGTSQNGIANFPAYAPGDWATVCMDWDAPGVGIAPNITVTIDEVNVANTFPSEGALLSAIENGVQTIQFRFSGSATTQPAGVGMFVDNISVADCSGTVIWTEDFESNSEGDVLTAPPYQNNTAYSSVVVEDATPDRRQVFSILKLKNDDLWLEEKIDDNLFEYHLDGEE